MTDGGSQKQTGIEIGKTNSQKNWQEVILLDTVSQEKHIADVRTEHGVVVEFQRSSIDPAEVSTRENFYQRMV